MIGDPPRWQAPTYYWPQQPYCPHCAPRCPCCGRPLYAPAYGTITVSSGSISIGQQPSTQCACAAQQGNK